jgi:nucleoside-diphosphate-sugar epimerase
MESGSINKTRNLVLGSEGFVGRSLCEYLIAQGEDVVRFDIKRSSAEDGRSALLDLDGIDQVYFLAWEVGGAKYLYKHENQIPQMDWNNRLMQNIFAQLQTARLPFLFVSSQLAEECDSVYGVTKRLGEVWTSLLGGVRVRLWNVFGGVEDVTEKSHVIADFVWQAVQQKEIRMLTTGTEMRQFIYIDDVCRGFHRALTDRATGVYDITTFEWCSVLETANIIAELTGAIVVPGTRVGSTPLTPMRGKLPNWRAEVSLRDGLQRLVAKIQAIHAKSAVKTLAR